MKNYPRRKGVSFRLTITAAALLGAVACSESDDTTPGTSALTSFVEQTGTTIITYPPVTEFKECDSVDREHTVSFKNDQEFRASIDQGSGYEITGTVAAPGGSGVSVTSSFESHYSTAWGARVGKAIGTQRPTLRGADTLLTYQQATVFAIGDIVVNEPGSGAVRYPYRIPIEHRFASDVRALTETPCESVFPFIPSDELPLVLGMSEPEATQRLTVERLKVVVVPADRAAFCRVDDNGNLRVGVGEVQFAVVTYDPLGYRLSDAIDFTTRPEGIQRESEIVLYLRPALCGITTDAEQFFDKLADTNLNRSTATTAP